jgi:hypothetical protein
VTAPKPTAEELPRQATPRELRVLRLVREWAEAEGAGRNTWPIAKALLDAARDLVSEPPPATRVDARANPTPPEGDARAVLDGLVSRWREMANDSGWSAVVRNTFTGCADALEQALARAEAPREGRRLVGYRTRRDGTRERTWPYDSGLVVYDYARDMANAWRKAGDVGVRIFAVYRRRKAAP